MIAGLKTVGKSLIAILVWIWMHTVVRAWLWLDISMWNAECSRYGFTMTIYARGDSYTIQKQFRRNQVIRLMWTSHKRKCDYTFELFVYPYWRGWLPFDFHTSFDKSWRCKECGGSREFPMPADRTCWRCTDKLAAKAKAEAEAEAVPEYVEEVW